MLLFLDTKLHVLCFINIRESEGMTGYSFYNLSDNRNFHNIKSNYKFIKMYVPFFINKTT